ncbi:hypothetical protein ACWGQ5_39340 [Streptomyces sp. NPDC055722]
MRRILGDAIGAAYFFHRLGPHQTQAAVAITELDFVEFRTDALPGRSAR